MQYLIIGGSIAAVSAIKAIRKNDPDGSITMVTSEWPVYYRPLIPLIIDGSRSHEDIILAENIAETHAVSLINDQALSLDPQRKMLQTAEGRQLAYDKILLATGSRPLIPAIAGSQYVLTLRYLADAVAIKGAAAQARTALVLGGGFVGVKAATALAQKGLEVTIVEKRPQILYPRLDRHAAEIIRQKIDAAGIKVITEETFAEIYPGGARLAGGGRLDADLMVAAIGVTPNIEWLDGSGVTTDQAVVVDEKLQTSQSDCHAAGDMVQATDLVTQKPAVSMLWTHAADMGRAAGTNMAGGKMRYTGFLPVMNAAEIDGIPMISVGAIGDDAGEVFSYNGPHGYRKLVLRNDRLVGAIFMGRIKNAGTYTSLIKTQADLGHLKDKVIRGTLNYGDFLNQATLSSAQKQ